MDERKVREKMSKSIPGGSSKDLDALIAQYNKDLMNYYRKNASRILPTEETAPGRSASRGCRGLCAGRRHGACGPGNRHPASRTGHGFPCSDRSPSGRRAGGEPSPLR